MPSQFADHVEEAITRLLPAHGGKRDAVGVWGLPQARLEGFGDALAQYLGRQCGEVRVQVNERCEPLVWVRAFSASLGSWSVLVAIWPD